MRNAIETLDKFINTPTENLEKSIIDLLLSANETKAVSVKRPSLKPNYILARRLNQVR